MRVFQNSGIYRAYFERLTKLRARQQGFSAWTRTFLNDRFGAAHFLLPVLTGDPSAFFTNGDDEAAQRLWATEHGLPRGTSLEQILLAQIEHHRTEVFYNLDPMRFSSDFVRKLPGCVRRSFAWRAAPSPGADFGAYDIVLCNFPSILEGYRQRGWRAAYFSPAHDPVMDSFAARVNRPVDVLFVGGYTRHHRRRGELLEAVAALSGEFNLRFHLDNSRATRLAESPLGYLLPLGRHRRPAAIRAIAHGPVFGMDLYEAVSNAKIVLNGAIDMAGPDRGNMRCFEAMGCGAALLSDTGNYPDGMVDQKTLVTWSDPQQAASRIKKLLKDTRYREEVALAGHQMIATHYSKSRQWEEFRKLAE
jgi:hypothetical protein